MIRWLIVIPFALIVAIGAGTTFFLVASIIDPVMANLTGNALLVGFWSLMDAVDGVDDPGPVVEGAIAGLGKLSFMILVAPPVLVALIGEVIGLRSLFWHAGATAILTGAVPWILRGSARVASPAELHVAAVLALTGAVAGLFYWLIAGRNAGSRPATAPMSRGS
jgi:hypothetical protein